MRSWKHLRKLKATRLKTQAFSERYRISPEGYESLLKLVANDQVDGFLVTLSTSCGMSFFKYSDADGSYCLDSFNSWVALQNVENHCAHPLIVKKVDQGGVVGIAQCVDANNNRDFCFIRFLGNSSLEIEETDALQSQ